MISVENISKTFDNFKALDDISCTIANGCIYGMVGSNGAGKSTFLRTITGIYKPDKGTVKYDGSEVYDNPQVKEDMVFVADELFFLSGASMKKMADYYNSIYDKFDYDRFNHLTQLFKLNPKKNIASFSKGMRRQAAIILALSTRARYLFFDETFDGLDPVMRQAVKSLFAGELTSRDFTPIVASHNLRELEDICDCVGILHQGGVLMQKDLEEMKLNIHTLQCVFRSAEDEQNALASLDIVKSEKRGSLNLITARGKSDEIMQKINSYSPILAEILPLTLEEIFISETEVIGYDIKKLIF